MRCQRYRMQRPVASALKRDRYRFLWLLPQAGFLEGVHDRHDVRVVASNPSPGRPAGPSNRHPGSRDLPAVLVDPKHVGHHPTDDPEAKLRRVCAPSRRPSVRTKSATTLGSAISCRCVRSARRLKRGCDCSLSLSCSNDPNGPAVECSSTFPFVRHERNCWSSTSRTASSPPQVR
jgi:hypothetical protein